MTRRQSSANYDAEFLDSDRRTSVAIVKSMCWHTGRKCRRQATYNDGTRMTGHLKIWQDRARDDMESVSLPRNDAQSKDTTDRESQEKPGHTWKTAVKTIAHG